MYNGVVKFFALCNKINVLIIKGGIVERKAYPWKNSINSADERVPILS